MQYLLQGNKEKDDVDIDIRIVEDVMKSSSRKINRQYIQYRDLDSVEDLNAFLPIGSIQFVEKWLELTNSIKVINPIEVPEHLRTKEFLKREYSIVPFEKIPRKGRYFLKDVSELKQFSYLGDLAEFNFDGIDETHLYQVSEIVDVYAEYRVYVIDGKIEAICQYDGNALAMCDPRYIIDRGLLIKANVLYSLQKDYPKSYTMDIIVNREGTSICEVHPFISIGLYTSLWGLNLLNAYKDGIDYVLKYNTKLESFKI